VILGAAPKWEISIGQKVAAVTKTLF